MADDRDPMEYWDELGSAEEANYPGPWDLLDLDGDDEDYLICCPTCGGDLLETCSCDDDEVDYVVWPGIRGFAHQVGALGELRINGGVRMNVERLDLGRCCACGKSGPEVCHVIALPKLAPVRGTGWGCFQCGLPMDGAQAVVCNSCLVTRAEIKEVVHGYLVEKRRIPIEELSSTRFSHNMAYHV